MYIVQNKEFTMTFHTCKKKPCSLGSAAWLAGDGEQKMSSQWFVGSGVLLLIYLRF